MDFRSFMIEGFNGEFNFLPEGANEDSSSLSAKSVNNETLVIDAEPITVVHPSKCVKTIGDYFDTPSDHNDEVGTSSKVTVKRKQIDEPATKETHQKARKVPPQASKTPGAASEPLDVDSDPEFHEFPSAKELKEADDSYFVVAHVTHPSWKKYLKEISLEKLYDIHDRAYMRQVEIDSLKQDKAVVVTKVVHDVAIKLVRSDEMGLLVSKLVKTAIFHGRCTTFGEVASFKEPFVLEKMPGYRTSSKEEFDQAG
ncbi:hypothetical protein Tco_0484484 [Tanacetum coccineum]